MNYLRIAWRNLWRNKRRTFITSASIMFAVFFAVIMRSFQLGTYDHMIKNIIESFSGFIQVQQVDYQDDMSLENSFAYTPEMLKKLDQTEGIKTVAPRIQSFALASTGPQTKGTLVIGFDPKREKELSDPGKRLVHFRFTDSSIARMESENIPQAVMKKVKDQRNESFVGQDGMEVALQLTKDEKAKWLSKIMRASAFPGVNLKPGDDGVLVADRLSKFLRIGVGDTLILLGQGYHGWTAQGLYPVRGIVKIPAPDLDNKLIFMPLDKAQDFYSMPGRLTTIDINPYNNSERNLPLIKQKVTNLLHDPSLVVKDWKQFNPVLKQQIDGDNQSGKAMLGLLYFIIFFGIFGTVLMMIHERSREFGVLIAIGMQRTRLAGILMLEMFLMGLLSVITGIIISLPILYIGHVDPLRITGEAAKVYTSMGFDPVMPMMWINTYVFWQGFIVSLMVVLSCLYPLRKVFKMKEVNALRA